MSTIIIERPSTIFRQQVRDPGKARDASQDELGRMALIADTVPRKRDELGILSLSTSPEVEQSRTVGLLFARTVSTRSSP